MAHYRHVKKQIRKRIYKQYRVLMWIGNTVVKSYRVRAQNGLEARTIALKMLECESVIKPTKTRSEIVD
jgi:hypothetical protein